MIDHRRQFIFIHIPKTAGVSVYEAFRWRGQQDHRARQDYAEDYFSFTFVRNPWDRAVSTYSYLRTGGRGNRGDLYAQNVLEPYRTFQDFGNNLTEIQSQFANFDARQDGATILGFPHLLPQTNWTHSDGVQIIDYVGRFETLVRDLSKIRGVLRLRRVRLGHANRSDRGDYRSFFDDRSAANVGEFYAQDVERFGYGFDDGAVQCAESRKV